MKTARVGERSAAAGVGNDSRYVDYANLGDARVRFRPCPRTTGGISAISRSESAHWYRKALDAYERSAELAREQNRKESEAHAAVRAARVHLQLIDLYSHERYYGSGDLSLAFYQRGCAPSRRVTSTPAGW